MNNPIEKKFLKNLSRLKAQTNALQIICAWSWAVLGWYNFHYWYLGGVVVTYCLVECWHSAVARQLANEYRKEKGIEQVQHPNND